MWRRAHKASGAKPRTLLKGEEGEEKEVKQCPNIKCSKHVSVWESVFDDRARREAGQDVVETEIGMPEHATRKPATREQPLKTA